MEASEVINCINLQALMKNSLKAQIKVMQEKSVWRKTANPHCVLSLWELHTPRFFPLSPFVDGEHQSLCEHPSFVVFSDFHRWLQIEAEIRGGYFFIKIEHLTFCIYLYGVTVIA